MRIEMNFKGLSGWLALGALAMTIAGPVSRPAYASSQPEATEVKTGDQKPVQAADKDVVTVALATPAPDWFLYRRSHWSRIRLRGPDL